MIDQETKDWFDYYYCYNEKTDDQGFAFHHFVYLYKFIGGYEKDKHLALTYQQKHQLFLELVRYYMEKDLLRFEGEYNLPSDPPSDIGKKPRHWGKNIGIEETITYFDTIFPRFDYDYPKYKITTKEQFYDKNYFKKHSEEEGKFTDFFYVYCPPALWWDEENQEWVED